MTSLSRCHGVVISLLVDVAEKKFVPRFRQNFSTFYRNCERCRTNLTSTKVVDLFGLLLHVFVENLARSSVQSLSVREFSISASAVANVLMTS